MHGVHAHGQRLQRFGRSADQAQVVKPAFYDLIGTEFVGMSAEILPGSVVESGIIVRGNGGKDRAITKLPQMCNLRCHDIARAASGPRQTYDECLSQKANNSCRVTAITLPRASLAMG